MSYKDWGLCNSATQLSLDYILIENYDRGLFAKASPMEISFDVRRGMEHAVIANCIGLWVDEAPGGNFLDYPAVPNDLASEMWLGLVLEGMADQLTFILEDDFTLDDPLSTPGAGWLQVQHL